MALRYDLAFFIFYSYICICIFFFLIGMFWVLFFQDLFATVFFIDLVHMCEHRFTSIQIGNK